MNPLQRLAAGRTETADRSDFDLKLTDEELVKLRVWVRVDDLGEM